MKLTKKECIKALRGLEMLERAENFKKWGGQVAPQIKCDIIEQLINEHFKLVEENERLLSQLTEYQRVCQLKQERINELEKGTLSYVD